MKYTVVTPLSRMHPKEGLQTFTHDDLIDIPDKAEAARMIAAGILAPVKGRDMQETEVETADLKPVGVEQAVKRGPKKG